MKACRNCGSKKYYRIVTTYTSEGDFDRCSECSNTANLDLGRGSSEVAGIYEDKNGNQLAVNNKGNPVKNVYAGDPRGWKHAGYGTKGYERTILHR